VSFSLLLLKRHAPMVLKGIHRWIFPDEWIMGSEPNINLEGSKAGPCPGFDSCPRATESGTTGDVSIQGQGSSHSLEAPPDVFESRREVDGEIPSEGVIEPSDLFAWNQDPHDYSLAFLESASVAVSRLLPNGARAPTQIPR
jgi:hypothetical protein